MEVKAPFSLRRDGRDAPGARARLGPGARRAQHRDRLGERYRLQVGDPLRRLDGHRDAASDFGSADRQRQPGWLRKLAPSTRQTALPRASRRSMRGGAAESYVRVERAGHSLRVRWVAPCLLCTAALTKRLTDFFHLCGSHHYTSVKRGTAGRSLVRANPESGPSDARAQNPFGATSDDLHLRSQRRPPRKTP